MPISEQTVRFLIENRLRNDREWFAGHRDEYKKIVFEPLAELTVALAPVMKQIDPLIVTEPKVDRCISRIYRDTRFSKDKSLYRDVAWVVFARDRKAYECPPALVVEISPKGFRYGCGWYEAPPKYMEALRSIVLHGDKNFLAAKKAFESQSVFDLQGDTYKRAKFPNAAEELKPWLERKNFDFMKDSEDFNLLFSEHLAEKLSKDFLMLKPIYDFLLLAEESLR